MVVLLSPRVDDGSGKTDGVTVIVIVFEIEP